jgi:hypothetical protein
VEGLIEHVVAQAARLGDENVLCILDQNLDAYERGVFTGTGLVSELRRCGFGGLVVIQSANDELEDERTYLAAGAGRFDRTVIPNLFPACHMPEPRHLNAFSQRLYSLPSKAPISIHGRVSAESRLISRCVPDGCIGKAVKGGAQAILDVLSRLWHNKFPQSGEWHG